MGIGMGKYFEDDVRRGVKYGFEKQFVREKLAPYMEAKGEEEIADYVAGCRWEKIAKMSRKRRVKIKSAIDDLFEIAEEKGTTMEERVWGVDHYKEPVTEVIKRVKRRMGFA